MPNEDNEERLTPLDRVRNQVTNVRIEMATLKTEVAQVKWIGGLLLAANLTLNFIGVQN